MSEQAVDVHVLVVSSAPGRTDASGPAVANQLEAAGHVVVDRFVVARDRSSIQQALVALSASGATAIVVLGGTTVFEERVSLDAAHALFGARLASFAPLALDVAQSVVGSQALWLDADAGLIGQTVVFLLPPSAEVAVALVERLVAPQLAAAVGWAAQAGLALSREEAEENHAEEGFGPDPETQDAVFEEVPPATTFGRLGRPAASVGVQGRPDAAPPPPEEGASPGAWERAIAALHGEMIRDRREDLPQPVERLAPLLDVLQQAGETAVMKLPSGVRYSLWGFPDLRRPGSKVLAVGWGQPLCEIIAMHRFPTQTGTCIDEGHGRLPRASTDVGRVSVDVTGRAPPDIATVNGLFAVDADAVWLLRGGRVTRWDGRKESEVGNPKQALVSLALAWSNK